MFWLCTLAVMGKIIISGMRFRSHIGVYDFEQQYGNNFEVDVEVDSPTVNGGTDSIEQTIDYAKIFYLVQAVMSQNCRLIEHAAKSILDLLVKEGLSGDAAMVRVSKLHPPLGSPVEKVAIELRWNKNE